MSRAASGTVAWRGTPARWWAMRCLVFLLCVTLAACGGTHGATLLATVSNPFPNTLPTADGSPWVAVAYALPGPTNVSAAAVSFPVGIDVSCNGGHGTTLVTCVASQRFGIGDGGQEGGDWVVATWGGASGPDGTEAYVLPPGAIPTFVPANSIAVDVWREP
jgi:hypothetical protein